MQRSHWGQHGPDCFGCKVSTIRFGHGDTPTHVIKGDPWKNNPVVDRIQELSGQEVNTDMLRPPGAPS